MKIFSFEKILDKKCDERIWSLYEEILEDNGKMELVRGLHISKLKALEKQALIDNVDSSARIEGIYISRERIEHLIDGKKPQKEFEGEIAGYGRVLKAINKDAFCMPVSSTSLLAMYAAIYSINLKETKSLYRTINYQNIMAEGQIIRTRVSPIYAFESPLYTGSMCDSLSDA
ncbi:MAG: hypothetical protein MJ189_04720, partial [Coriobacteriales bacterium]|nr:hypothetical protein [Coriobacteriales bacterium]